MCNKRFIVKVYVLSTVLSVFLWSEYEMYYVTLFDYSVML